MSKGLTAFQTSSEISGLYISYRLWKYSIIQTSFITIRVYSKQNISGLTGDYRMIIDLSVHQLELAFSDSIFEHRELGYLYALRTYNEKHHTQI